MVYVVSAGRRFTVKYVHVPQASRAFFFAGGWPVRAKPRRALSPAARLGRRRSAKTNIWLNTAPVSVSTGTVLPAPSLSQARLQARPNTKHVSVFDQLDVISYEEVVRLPAFKRKTLVLIGKQNPVILINPSSMSSNMVRRRRSPLGFF